MSSAALVEALREATGAEPQTLERLLRRGPLARSFDELVDGLVLAIDATVGRQLDALYATPKLRELESHWRGLALVVERLAGITNLKCEFVNVSREDLMADFDDSPTTPKSGLHKLTYSAEYGPFGGRPYAAVFTTYTFEDRPEDLALLRLAGETCWRTAVPFVARAAPSLQATSKRWNEFRARPEARHVALLDGDVLVRPPHSIEGSFEYAQPDDLAVWAAPSALLAITVARSFEQYRLPLHAFGRRDGAVRGLPCRAGVTSRSSVPSSPFVDPVTHGRARGVIPLVQVGEGEVMLAGDTTAALPVRSALPGVAPADLELNARLPALFLAGRILHYLKVTQREQIGTWMDGALLVEELEAWLRALPAPRLFSFFEIAREDYPSWHSVRLTLRTATGAGTIVVHNYLDKE